MERLRKRADFLKTAQGRRWNTPNFTLQARLRIDDPVQMARLGFTVTKKIGNAVERNRVRRRLRGLVVVAKSSLEAKGLPNDAFDYVLVGRQGAIDADFETMRQDLVLAFEGVHRIASSAKASRKTTHPHTDPYVDPLA